MGTAEAIGWRDWRELARTYLLPSRRRVGAMAGLLFASIALQVATPQLVRMVLDRATEPGSGSLRLLAGIYVGVAVAQQVTRLGAAWLSEVVGWLTTNRLRADLLRHCLGLDAGFHAEHPPGDLIERVDGDVSGLGLFFSHVLFGVIGNLLLLVGILGVMWWQQLLSGFVLTLLATAGVTAIVLVRRVGQAQWVVAREASARLFGFVEERLAGTEDLRSCGAEEHTLRGLLAVGRERTWTNRDARIRDAVHWTVNSALFVLADAVAFVVPAVLVRRGSLTIGGAFAVYYSAQLLVHPLHEVSHQVGQLQQAAAGARRVRDLLRLRPTIVDGPGELPVGRALSVELRHVDFAYGADPPVLHGVGLVVPAGRRLGIVGRTGSGKSTIARLLARIHDPTVGAVLLGGVDLRDVPVRTARSRVALVTQEVHLLSASVRDNVTLFDHDVSDERILDAVDRLGLRPWLDGLPAGLDTVLRDGGSGMSAGQAQLLAFARTFLSDPAVVVLDEASSRLDPATEALLEHAVDALLDGRTGIVIAHRLSTLARCDDVCVLDHGVVVEHGPRRALAADPASRFAGLLAMGLDAAPPVPTGPDR